MGLPAAADTATRGSEIPRGLNLAGTRKNRASVGFICHHAGGCLGSVAGGGTQASSRPGAASPCGAHLGRYLGRSSRSLVAVARRGRSSRSLVAVARRGRSSRSLVAVARRGRHSNRNRSPRSRWNVRSSGPEETRESSNRCSPESRGSLRAISEMGHRAGIGRSGLSRDNARPAIWIEPQSKRAFPCRGGRRRLRSGPGGQPHVSCFATAHATQGARRAFRRRCATLT